MNSTSTIKTFDSLLATFNYFLFLKDNKELSKFISKNLESIHGIEELYSHIFRQLINHKKTSLLITALQAGLNPNLSTQFPIIIHGLIIFKLQEDSNTIKEKDIETFKIFIKYTDITTSFNGNTIIHCILNHTHNYNCHYSFLLLKLFLPLLKDPLKKNESGKSPIDFINHFKNIQIDNIKDIKDLLLLYEYINKN